MLGNVVNPQVELITECGSIILEVYPDKAPVTVTNFLRYVDERRFQEASFFRVVNMSNQTEDEVKIDVIQGGLQEGHKDILPSIEHETTKQSGILHKDGIVSMARFDVGTTAGSFFICVGDQPELDYGGRRYADGQGFAAFGKVVSGMAVVKKIWQWPAPEEYLASVVPIQQCMRVEGLEKIANV